MINYDTCWYNQGERIEQMKNENSSYGTILTTEASSHCNRSSITIEFEPPAGTSLNTQRCPWMDPLTWGGVPCNELLLKKQDDSRGLGKQESLDPSCL